MVGTAKRLRPADLQTLQQFRRKRRRVLVRNILLLTFYLGIVMLSHTGTVFYKSATSRTGWFNAYLACVIVGFLGFYLALAPLCLLLIRVFKVHALPRVLRWQNMFFLNLYLLISIPIVLLIITIWKPFRFLYAGFFGDITAECFCITIVTCILLLLTRRVLPFPRFSQVIRQIFIGIVLAVVFSFVLGLLTPLAGFSFHLANTQLWQGGILFAMLWPTFLLYEGVVHNWAEEGTLPAFLLSFSVRVFFLIILYIFATLSQEKEFIKLIWPIPIVLFIFLQRCCSLLYREGRAVIAGVTLNACTIAWLLALHYQ
jgi:hypothetical protein